MARIVMFLVSLIGEEHICFEISLNLEMLIEVDRFEVDSKSMVLATYKSSISTGIF